MSWVTNTILHFGSLDGRWEQEALAKVNAFLEEDCGQRFVSIADENLPKYWYGGSKVLECSLAIAAFNHLDIDGLVQRLCTLCYNNDLDALETQLILKDQEEQHFHVINIDEEMRKRGMVPDWMKAMDAENNGSP